MATDADVRRISLTLPGAYERESYGGSPSWRTTRRMFAWIRDDDGALVVWASSVEEKEALIAAEPEKYSTTPHYSGHPAFLVNLTEIDVDELTELITDSWRYRSR